MADNLVMTASDAKRAANPFLDAALCANKVFFGLESGMTEENVLQAVQDFHAAADKITKVADAKKREWDLECIQLHVKNGIEDLPDDLKPKARLLFYADGASENNPELASLVTAIGFLACKTWADAALVLGELSWSWPAWLPNGLLTMLGGEQGSGKSILALRIAASFITGQPWPDGTPFTGRPGTVLWVETESGQGLNTERARTWGLPLNKLLTPGDDPLADVALDDTACLEAIAQRAYLPDVGLIVVDSLSGGNTRRDENSSQSMLLTKHLAELAKGTRKPILLVHHLRKKGPLDNGNTISLEQFRGSSAITQVARVVWAIDQPNRNTETRRLSIVKYNIGKRPEPLGMTISDDGVFFDAQPPETPHEETQTDKAVDLLLALLNHQPMRQVDIKAEMEGAGISWRTVERAKKALHVVSRKDGGNWCWSLPTRED